MSWKQIGPDDPRTFVIVFQRGDEVARGLSLVSQELKLQAASFTAIGAFDRAVLAWFNPAEQRYEEHSFADQMEVLTLAGNMVPHAGKPKVHAHAVLGFRDFQTRGGHLVEARVNPTLEVVLVELPQHLRRRHDPAVGLPLIDLQ
jgi:predicted DNA-binding protein with PD1-like motif